MSTRKKILMELVRQNKSLCIKSPEELQLSYQEMNKENSSDACESNNISHDSKTSEKCNVLDEKNMNYSSFYENDFTYTVENYVEDDQTFETERWNTDALVSLPTIYGCSARDQHTCEPTYDLQKPDDPKTYSELQPICYDNDGDTNISNTLPTSDDQIIITHGEPKELQPVSYDEVDSPADDSDLDPNYEPNEETLQIKRKYHAFTTSHSDPDVNGESISENKENTQKKKRARSEKQQIENHLKKYHVLEACSCKKKCAEHFSEKKRDEICKAFWHLTFGERRQYFNAHITLNAIKQRKTESNNKRQCSVSYTMSNADGTKKEVCKLMFLHTHGLKTDGMITEFKKKQNLSKGLDIVTDKRGNATPPNKKDTEVFRLHIETFNPQVSHYKLSHAPNRRYLPQELSVTYMWKDFCERHEKVSYEKYRHEFNLQNIGFEQPSQDECTVCILHNEHEKICTSSRECCTICTDFDKHHLMYIEARKAYEKDRDKKYPNSFGIYSVDMQKVLLLPKMSLKSSVFVSKLVVFNETFASLLKNGENICVLWHEAISGRLAEDVASAYLAVIQRASADIEYYIFWCDNCSAQNKNWRLYAALVSIVNSNWGPKSITIKYFEAGHSYMKADAVHGQIGKALKKKANIYDLNELNDLILKTSRKNKTLLMSYEDFYEFKEGVRQRKKTDETIPFLNEVKIAEFRKGSKNLFFKKKHTDLEFFSCDFLKPKYNTKLPDVKKNNRGINTDKKNKILRELVPSMPPVKKIFWEKLPISESSSDLLTTRN